jgi:hypothetical protein
MKTRSNGSFILGAAASAALLCSSMASAVDVTDGSLGLAGGDPDLNIWNPTLDFDGTNFSVVGDLGAELTDGSSSAYYIPDTSTTFGFSIDGDVSGTSTTGFSLNIDYGTDTLLASDSLLSIGYSTSDSEGSIFEFIFGDITGSLGDLFGDTVGIIFASTDSVLGGFDFSNALNGSVDGALDVFAVPEPGTLGIFFVGLSSLLLFGRKKSNA